MTVGDLVAALATLPLGATIRLQVGSGAIGDELRFVTWEHGEVVLKTERRGLSLHEPINQLAPSEPVCGDVG